MKKRDIRAQIFIVENGQYILLKHHHKKENRFFWGVPGGGKEENETIEEAAIREAKEETHLDVKLLPFKHEDFYGEKERLYNRKATFIGYPIGGIAKTGYDPEEDMCLLFELVDIKWQPIDYQDDIDEQTRNDLLPVKEYLGNNNLTKRAGALVFKMESNIMKCLVVSMNQNQDWFTLPQGHVEDGETCEEAAIRETIEEAGVEIKIKKDLGYFFHDNQKGIYQTYIYLGEYVKDLDRLEKRVVKWVTYEESLQLNMPKEARRYIKEMLEGKYVRT